MGYALSSGGAEGLGLRSLLLEMGIMTEPVNVLLYSDSTGAISAQSRLGLGKLMKHVEIRHLFLQELVKQKRITIEKISTHHNVSDMLTKYLAGDVLAKHARSAGLRAENAHAGRGSMNAVTSGSPRANGAILEVLRGIRVCLVGLAALVPPVEGTTGREMAMRAEEACTRGQHEAQGAAMRAVIPAVTLAFTLGMLVGMVITTGCRRRTTSSRGTQLFPAREWLMKQTVEALRSDSAAVGLRRQSTKETQIEQMLEYYAREEVRIDLQEALRISG